MKVFLTGATGIVGSIMVKEFLGKGAEIFCLVRGNSTQSAEMRLCEKLGEVKLPENCHIVEGDITKEFCGIKNEDLEDLKSKGIDFVFHCAACTKMEDKYQSTSLNINILGTQNVINFTKRLEIGKIVFVSTAYVANGMSNVYENTKAKAEGLIKDSGIPYTIARISMVIGDSQNGEIVDFTGYYGFVLSAYKIINRFGKDKMLFAEAKNDATLNLITVDWVAKMLALISMKEPYFGVLDVINNKPIQVEVVLRMGLKVLGINKNVEFREKLGENEEREDVHKAMFNKVVKILRPYTSKTIDFSDKALKDFLKEEYEEAYEINDNLIEIIIKYAKAVIDKEFKKTNISTSKIHSFC